jgi:hypothetical protein
MGGWSLIIGVPPDMGELGNWVTALGVGGGSFCVSETWN